MSSSQNLLIIEVSQLVEAMTNNQIEFVYYLDLQNGNILTINEDDGTGVTKDGWFFGIEYTPDLRFIFIEPLLPSERQFIYELFIESLPVSAVRDYLKKDLETRGTITVNDNHELQKLWQAFLDKEVVQTASDWFSQIGVDVQILPRGKQHCFNVELSYLPEEGGLLM